MQTPILSLKRTALLFAMLAASLAISPLLAGYSPDDDPRETLQDPGDVFFPSGALEVDDVCPAAPPFPSPCLGPPLPDDFDLDAFSIDLARQVCPPTPPPNDPGILFSIDDGDPGAGSGVPDRPTELLFYDRCNRFGGGSFLTNADEAFLSLGANPPPSANDDDVDAYETEDSESHWNIGGLVFSPDEPRSGGLGPDPGCFGSIAAGTLYRSDSGGSAAFYASPCSLGVPDVENCDIDALTLVTGEEPFPAEPLQVLFSTDSRMDCGLDAGDIFISDNAGNFALWADDVRDLRIAQTESDPVDLDALSVNADGPIAPGTPFDPSGGVFWKGAWPDYALSGIPDLSQDHAAYPDPTWCGPTAVADVWWWLDSKMEGRCGGGPGDGVDDFPLVPRLGGALDDHGVDNVEPLVQDLANCMMTDPVLGTDIVNMEACVIQKLTAAGQSSDFTVTRRNNPSFGEIACAVERSEAVVLLVGFWNAPGSRCGGHYLAVSGVQRFKDVGPDGAPGQAGLDDDSDGAVDEPDETCPCGAAGPVPFGDDVCTGPDDRVAVSDPGLNNVETGAPGRLLGGAHADHAPALAPPPDHADTRNVSHDTYDIGPSGSNQFQFSLRGYGALNPGDPTPCPVVERWCGQNPTVAEIPPVEEPCSNFVDVDVEAMIAIAPDITDVCIDIRGGLNALLVHKNACPSPAFTPDAFDYVRGELCQLSESAIQVDLGEVDCLVDDTPADQYLDETTWDVTRGIGAWFFLARDDMLGCDYGFSAAGNPRTASAGDCPCP